MSYIVDIRDRRQITIPKEVLEWMGISVGDKLVFKMDDQGVEVKSVEVRAMESLEAIGKAFRKAGITEEELQKSGREIREELVKERYEEE